jgi:hypothetical protein
LSVRKNEIVIVIEAQAKRKRFPNHRWDANQNSPLTGTAPPIMAAGGCRFASRMELLPLLFKSAKAGEKSSRKPKKFSIGVEFPSTRRWVTLEVF